MEGLKKAAFVSRILIGLVFLVAGLIKVWDPVLFYWEVIPYTQLLGLQRFWQPAAEGALILAPLEFALGLALLVNWRPRLVFSAGTALLVFFIGLMIHAWRLGATESCGCFGTLVDRGPGQAAVEDIVMLGLLLLGWWGSRSAPPVRRAGAIVGAGLILASAVGCVRFFPEKARLEQSDLKPGVSLASLRMKGLDMDLTDGDFLVELMSPRCHRCMNAVPELNLLFDEPDLPPLIALNSFPQGSVLLEEFKARFQPRFPIATISRTDFFRLTWKHGFPRLAYLRNGVIQKVWEYYEFPTPGEVLKAMEEADDKERSG